MKKGMFIFWLISTILLSQETPIESSPFDIVSENMQKQPIDEVSGLVFHPIRNTLFIVNDEGFVVELNKENGSLLQLNKDFYGYDLEGITVNPENGILYLAAEGDETIFEVSPETLSLLRTFKIIRKFKGSTVLKSGGQGLEGITFIPGNPPVIVVSNQSFELDDLEDTSALAFFTLPESDKRKQKVHISEYIPLSIKDIAGLYYDAKTHCLQTVSDTNDELIIFSLEGTILSREKLPGKDQEGIAIDNEGYYYIADDSGKLLKLKRHN